MKKTVAILLLIVLILGLLAACGGKDGGSKNSAEKKYLGLYKFSMLGDMTVQEYADQIGMSLEEAQNFMTLELKSGGKAVFSTDGDSTDIEWKLDGDKISLTGTNPDGSVDTIDGTIKDNAITLDFDGEIITLAK